MTDQERTFSVTVTRRGQRPYVTKERTAEEAAELERTLWEDPEVLIVTVEPENGS